MLTSFLKEADEIVKNVSLALQFGPDAKLASDYLNGMMAQAQFLHAHYLMFWSISLLKEFRSQAPHKKNLNATSTISL
jgi:hypothetical protein